jgi:hypothetical protein
MFSLCDIIAASGADNGFSYDAGDNERDQQDEALVLGILDAVDS